MSRRGSRASPAVSIVVPSVNGFPCLEGCLERLERHAGGDDVEVVVVDRTGASTRERVARRFPDARLLEASPETPIDELRARGVSAAGGETIAILEDHCMIGAGWIDPVRRLSSAPWDAVGGPVENGATERLRDWAAFLCEYSHLVGPVEEGEVADLPAVNAAYRAELLRDAIARLRPGGWDVELHRRMRERGARLRLEPGMEVVHRRPFGIREYAAQRFHYSRTLMAARADDWGPGRRALWLLAAPILPAVLLARIVGRLASRGRHGGVFLGALPLIVAYTLVWTAGEAVGVVAGPGDSPGRVL